MLYTPVLIVVAAVNVYLIGVDLHAGRELVDHRETMLTLDINLWVDNCPPVAVGVIALDGRNYRSIISVSSELVDVAVVESAAGRRISRVHARSAGFHFLVLNQEPLY